MTLLPTEQGERPLGEVEETPEKGFIQRLKEWRRRAEEAEAAHELLEVIAEERERSSALESQLKAESEKRSSLEMELEIAKRALAESESKLRRLNDRIDLLEGELRAALEACLLSYLKEHKGTISIKEYASDLKVGEARINEALEALAKRGKIKIA